MANPSIILLPGLGGSGPDHWQYIWSQQDDHIMIEVDDWNNPNLEQWVETLDNAISRIQGNFILAAHSLGCALAAQWITQQPVKPLNLIGVLMVAPADIDDENYTPKCTRHFGPMPLNILGCKTITVISTNDPYVSVKRATYFNNKWKGHLIDIGEKGHINGDSGLGEWPEGQLILSELNK